MTKMLSMAALLCAATAAYAQTPAQTTAEVAQLLEKVEQSKCAFDRNGSLYDAKSARKHLKDKFDYLDKKNMLTTTESFISLGAASSSSSGKAYRIACPGMPVVTSAAWLTAELAKLRSAK